MISSIGVSVPAVQRSTAALVFAAWIASRREQSPSLLSSSVVVFTVIVAAWSPVAPRIREQTIAERRKYLVIKVGGKLLERDMGSRRFKDGSVPFICHGSL